MAWLAVAAVLCAGILVLLLTLLYLYHTSAFNYWKKRGLSGPKPVPFFGNFRESMTGQISLGEQCATFYHLFKRQGYGGVYRSEKPVLVVCDPALIKQMLTKDFASITDHGLPVDDAFLGGHLFNLRGELWRHQRYRLAPTFTSGRIKLMYPFIKECVDDLIAVLRLEIAGTDSLELRDLLGRFATDLIGACAFGLQCSALRDGNSEFYTMATKILRPNTFFAMRSLLAAIHKKLARLLPLSWVFPGMTEFYVGLMKDTVHYRKVNEIRRNDFVDLCMGIKAKDDEAKSKGQELPFEFTDTSIAAQAFDFFTAGLDNLANTVGFCLHEIALNQPVQDRLVEDVNSTVAKHDGQLTDVAVKDMAYLDKVFDETLRKYTADGLIIREVTASEYLIPGTDVLLNQGTGVFIPTQAIHMDPDIYPNPDRFDPERFTDEAKSQRHPYTFLPFGEGPRFCIAKRFALLASKLCIASLVREFRFWPCSKTAVPLKTNTGAFGPYPLDGFWLKVEKRVSLES